MFQSARLRLTLWYLMTMLMVSLFFSIIIFNGATIEFRRALSQVEERLELTESTQAPGQPAAPGDSKQDIMRQDLSSPEPVVILPEVDTWRQRQLHRFRAAVASDILTIQHRVANWLAFTNGVIFVLAAVGSYFLAGRTLKPIQETLEKQKLFVADASHELKTPLTALKTNLEVALRDPKLHNHPARQVITDSLNSVHELQNLTESLLSAARIEQQGRLLQFTKIDVRPTIQTVLKQLQPLLSAKDLELTSAIDDCVIAAESQSFTQLFTILLDNASKYTPEHGQITLTVKKMRQYCLFNVTDTGEGIAKADLPHIFDRFYRAEHSRNKKVSQGFGLGLALAKQIVDAHHGTIMVKSKPGAGTTVTIKLPLVQSD